MSAPVVLEPEKHAALIPSIVQLHIACIMRDDLVATFLPPLDAAAMERWWTSEINNSTRTTYVTLSGSLPSNNEDASMSDWPTVTGVVQLGLPFSQSEPYRCEVYKLMVSPDARRQGIAKKLMTKLEQAAIEKNRPIITLDTVVGSPAEGVYPKLGYTRIGVIPNYGISPKDGKLVDEVFFYKDLRKTPMLED